MAQAPGIHAPAVIIQERCEVLAEAGLVAFVTEDCKLVELTTTGQQDLEGKVDVAVYPWPQHPALKIQE